ncbi:MerR family transcriptional regulator [Anaerovorax odorimutans]|uniref:MerR family transcriptional regulator n=1 Tax=Anaerovorax odorimutans TaxID=109327 RepID=UPI00040DA3E8|nr:MerR family transcriptional regulator [Anaerovorax odorimutans]
MKDIISITEMAKLRNVTTETLRYYDRIDLFKPIYVDPETNYRYYSILQYEKLGTIRELCNLGMPLKDIKTYLENRTVRGSCELLMEQKNLLDSKIDSLVKLKSEIEEKLNFIRELEDTGITNEIKIKQFSKRKYVTFNRVVSDEVELSYDSVQLESMLPDKDKAMPIFATNRYGGIISKSDIDKGKTPLLAKMIILCDEENKEVSDDKVIEIEEGNFACLYFIGKFWDRRKSIENLMDFIKRGGYMLAGDILQMQWVDYSITNNLDEISYEFQAPIKKLV